MHCTVWLFVIYGAMVRRFRVQMKHLKISCFTSWVSGGPGSAGPGHMGALGAVVKVENGHRGIYIFSRAPSPYLRAARNSTGPFIFFTGPIAGLILRIFMDSTYFWSWRNSRPVDIFSTQNKLFPFRAQLATGGGGVVSQFWLPFTHCSASRPFCESS